MILTRQSRRTVVRIAPTTAEQTADMRPLQAADFHRRREVTYADQYEAGITHVQSVVSETSQGKTIFTVTLAPLPQLNNSSVMEFNFNSMSLIISSSEQMTFSIRSLAR